VALIIFVGHKNAQEGTKRFCASSSDLFVISAQAGIHCLATNLWIPACAGMTNVMGWRAARPTTLF
jgi:hypothetical protein